MQHVHNRNRGSQGTESARSGTRDLTNLRTLLVQPEVSPRAVGNTRHSVRIEPMSRAGIKRGQHIGSSDEKAPLPNLPGWN